MANRHDKVVEPHMRHQGTPWCRILDLSAILLKVFRCVDKMLKFVWQTTLRGMMQWTIKY